MELLDGAVSFIDWVRPHAALPTRGNVATERLPSTASESPARLAAATPAPASPTAVAATPSYAATAHLKFVDAPSIVMPLMMPSALHSASAWATGVLDVARLREALAQLAVGVAAIHAAGKLHRDLKPNNVLVTPQGRVALVDFGFTLRAHDSVDYCTPAYMAPEQAKRMHPTKAADWYAVGVMLYEALTGDIPFAPLFHDMKRALAAKCEQDPPSPQLINPAAPPDLVELCMALLQRDPAARPDGAALRRHLAPAARSRRRSFSIQPQTRPQTFLGRDGELATLRRAFEASRQAPTAVLVVGESGVGKSELVAHFLPVALGADAVVLSGRCYESETVPFKAWDCVIDQLSDYWAQLPTAEAAAMRPIDADILLQVFPVLRRVPVLADSTAEAGPTLSPQAQRQRVFTAVRETLRHVAQRGQLVIVIDDLQWADQDSLDLLAAVGSVADAPPMLFVATARLAAHDDDATHVDVLGTVRALLPQAHELALGVLPTPAALSLARALMGDDVPLDVQGLVAEAGGHPLLIEELVRAARATGSDRLVTLEQALQARLGKLTPLGRRLIDLLAVAGQPLSRGAAAIALGSEMAAVADAIEALQVAHLVRTDGMRRGDRVEAYHDRIRQVAISRLPAATLQQIHEQLATALEGDDEANPEFIATHWRSAGNPARAAHYLLRAADASSAKLAFNRASRLFGELIELWPEAISGHRPWRAHPPLHEIWEKLGDARASQRQAQPAATAFQQAAARADGDERRRLLHRAADQLLRCGQIDAGHATLVPLLDAAGVPLPRSRGAAVATLLGHRVALQLRGGFAAGLRRAERRLPPTGITLPEATQHRLELCWTTLVDFFSVDQLLGIVYYCRYTPLAFASGQPLHLSRAAATEAIYITANHGSASAAQARLDDAQRLAERAADAAPFVIFARAMVEFLRGNWRALRIDCERFMAATDARRHQYIFERAMLHQIALWSLCFCGELTALARYAGDILQAADESDDLFSAMSAKSGYPSLVWLVADDPVRARREASAAIAQWSQQGFHVQHLFDLICQTHIDLYEGKARDAAARFDALWPALAKSGLLRVQMNRALIADLHARILLARLTGEAIDAPARRELTARARKLARSLHRENRPWLAGLATLIDAQLDGNRDGYLRAAAIMSELGLELHANLARLASAEPEATSQALRFIASHNVANPQRLAAVFVPHASGLADGQER
ncbi:MAG: AAA family ATPase [Myxococcales bacterium]|nr:AAA family ATPase [Myxococcales bacterium]